MRLRVAIPILFALFLAMAWLGDANDLQAPPPPTTMENG